MKPKKHNKSKQHRPGSGERQVQISADRVDRLLGLSQLEVNVPLSDGAIEAMRILEELHRQYAKRGQP